MQPKFSKTRPDAPQGFFAAEAAGLRWLGLATPHGGVSVPQVHSVERGRIVMDRVEVGAPSPRAAREFGRRLAATHRTGAAEFGTAPAGPGFIATLPLPFGTGSDWPGWYARCRVLPFLGAAGLLTEDRSAVERLVEVIASLPGATESPARLHGDLWSGNVLWGSDDQVWLIDPSAHGGHRETDLAMLALFGLPYLDDVLAAYHEASPLQPGWRMRVPVHQLYPLLVHAVLFGGRYRTEVGAAARAGLAAL